MASDDMYSRPHGGMEKSFRRTIQTQGFQGMKNGRMMGDDKFGIASFGLGNQRAGRVQGEKNGGDPTVRTADKQADIIPGPSEIKRGDLLKNMNYMGLRFHKMGLIDHLEAVSRINFSNAISFINEEILKSQLKITIKDTGIGMVKNVLEKIFTPFYSADHARYPDKKGLGLTFSREIVQNHNGVIDVWSSPNAGSSFSVILPLKETIDIVTIPGKDEKPALALGNEWVLLVDDEERILKVGREICTSLGYSVITVNSGKKAIKVYKEKKEKIDLVVLDMIMPEMNGLETFLELKKLNPDIKALLSTGYSIDEKAQEMLRQGCKGYLLKPYNVIDFSHKLREVIQS